MYAVRCGRSLQYGARLRHAALHAGTRLCRPAGYQLCRPARRHPLLATPAEQLFANGVSVRVLLKDGPDESKLCGSAGLRYSRV